MSSPNVGGELNDEKILI